MLCDEDIRKLRFVTWKGVDMADTTETTQTTQSRTEKTRYGAPDGPRQKRDANYDGRDPLPYPGHEIVAEFLATPKGQRQVSIKKLAEHFQVTPKTIHCWARDRDVLRRATFLTQNNKLLGDLAARRDWGRIVEAQVAKAAGGDTTAAKFCEQRAWPEDGPPEGLYAALSIAELVRLTEEQNPIVIADDLVSTLDFKEGE